MKGNPSIKFWGSNAKLWLKKDIGKDFLSELNSRFTMQSSVGYVAGMLAASSIAGEAAKAIHEIQMGAPTPSPQESRSSPAEIKVGGVMIKPDASSEDFSSDTDQELENWIKAN